MTNGVLQTIQLLPSILNGTNCVVGLSEYCCMTFSFAIFYVFWKKIDADNEVESKYREIGGNDVECIDHAVVPKQFPAYQPSFDRAVWKNVAWAGRVDDEPRALWVDYMRDNVDPDYVDDDPDEGPQPLVDDDLEEWDGGLEEDWNADEGTGGIYGLSDDEKATENDDYCIFKCEENDSVGDLRGKKMKAAYRTLCKDKAISLGIWDEEYPPRLLDDFVYVGRLSP